MTDPLVPYNAGVPAFQPSGAPFPPQETPFAAPDDFFQPADAFSGPQDAFFQPQDTFFLPKAFLPEAFLPEAMPDKSWSPRVPPKPRRWLMPGALALAGLLAAGGMTYALASGPPTQPAAAGPAAPGAVRPTGTGSGGHITQGTAQPAGAAPTAAATPDTGGQGLLPPVTLTAAQAILASYTAVNNTANARESDAALGTYETGSSFALDSGIYRVEMADNRGPYPAFAPARTRFYIPLEKAAAYPHWFATQVTNVTLAAAHRVTDREYLVFLQAAPGAPWKDAFEPYLTSADGAPQVALSPQGYATAVGQDAENLAVPAASMTSVTAASLDGTGPVRNPGNLADFAGKAFWRSKLRGRAAVTDRHTPDAGGFFGLRTADGGALLFYADAASVTIMPPYGQTVRLRIPGFDDGTRRLTKAGLSYLEQFAAYDPPRAGVGDDAFPSIIADFSGITASS
jgi:hypothetical protein